MSNKHEFSSPENCLQALSICLVEIESFPLDTEGMRKAASNALACYVGADAALTKLRLECDLYRAALLRIANQWRNPERDRDVALAALAETNENKS